MLSRSNVVLFVFILFLFSENNIVLGQATPNPCGFSKINCGEAPINTLYTSFFGDTIVYSSPGRSMPFWFALGDSVTETIDTTGSYNFSLSKISGPGDIKGIPGTLNGYYSYLTDISFSAIGTYEVAVNVGGFPGSFVGRMVFVVPPEIDFCTEAPGGDCGEVTGNQVFPKQISGGVVPVDEVLPEILVGVIDSVSGLLDSSFSGTIYIEKASGPGELYGVLSMAGERWFNFNNLKLSEPGMYVLRFFTEDSALYKEAFVEVEVIQATNSSVVLVRDDLSVYPNPFQDKITLTSSYDLKGVTIELLNYSGQKVFFRYVSKSTQRLVLNTDDLTSGLYILSLFGTHVFQNKTLKIVK